MDKRRKRIVILVLIGWGVVALGLNSPQWVDDYRASTEAARARDEAAAATSSTFTFADARHWLEQHNFRVVVWNPHVPDGYVANHFEDHVGQNGPRPTYRVVTGQRELSRRALLTRES